MINDEDLNVQLKNLLSDWIKIEELLVSNSTNIIEKTENPIIQIIMEIMKQDSIIHKKIQKLLLNNIDSEFLLDEDELNEVVKHIEQHNIMELQAEMIAEKCFAHLRNPLQKLFFEFLLNDENKHLKLLKDLNNLYIK